MRRVGFAAAFACSLLAAKPASGQSPAALVEDIVGNPPGVEFMDYVDTGKLIQLGPKDSLVLSYLSSCVRESIQGGSVKIGVQQSDVSNGVIARTKVDCEASKMLQAVGQTSDAASLIVRGAGAAPVRRAPAPAFRIYGSSPIFDLSGIGALVVARLDEKGEYFSLTIDSKQLTRGRFLDFAAQGKSLTPGGVYGARWAGRLITFKVDENARPDRAPAVGRLLRLGSQN